ncbi:gliding motility-associated C-terminal domain-containing protein [Flavobacterium sp. LS2P90]|uniref:Gliding motility-associated C-terminal domain-containing protein n=1 Tax=Flavobacterium xylosi TaxID=3230415 RepID=A0ABW6HYV6_9FLAO
MILKILFPSKANLLHYIILLLLFFSAINTNAQCAGSDNSVTVCNIPDPSSKSIDLFSLLGSYTTGGIWTDNFFSGGLNLSTGILNAQIINKSGVYTYTYSVDNGTGCNDSATITVTIGGYSGISSPNVSACSDDLKFNLFQGFNGNFLSPQSNGTWSDNDGTGALTDNFLNATKAGLGTHSFTYTMRAIGTCPAQSSTVNVTVFRAPDPGIGNVVLLCDSDFLTFNTNLNLNDILIGEDANGKWMEVSGTSELSSSFDSTIDVRHIYDTFGAGAYNFIYSVLPSNPICDIKTSAVTIIIEKQLDLTGAKLVVNSDICENEITKATYNAVLNQGIQKIPNGSYFVTYTISEIVEPITIISNFNNGVLTFGINRLNFPQVGNYTVTVIDIARVGSLGACKSIISSISDVLNVFPLPKIDKATLTIDPVCKGFDAIVKISGDTNLTEGNYSIFYNLSDSNIAIAQQAFFKVAIGTGTFVIPASLIPVVGNIKISITNITNLFTGCTNVANITKEFGVKPLPDFSNLKLDIKEVCQNQAVVVSLSGLGILANITINYNLTGVNNATNQSLIIPVSAGNASFIVPSSSLINAGITSLVITDIIDNVGGCGSSISNGTKSFMINSIPNTPATKDELFCKNDKKTIADLTPNGTKYQWFSSVTNITILPSNTLLVSGNYYVKEVNAVTGCESGRVSAVVVISEVQAPTLNQDGQNFCGLDNPTLQNLTDNVTTNGTITWFDAPTNGNQIVLTDLLKDGFSYYGFDYSSATNCYSSALVVTVSLSNCDETPGFFIPDGFSPNGDAVNDTFRIPDIEFIYPDYSLEIYNRYGTLMFTGNKNKAEWDGKNSDSNMNLDGMAPNGIYFYIINFNKGNISPKQGRLYLNR